MGLAGLRSHPSPSPAGGSRPPLICIAMSQRPQICIRCSVLLCDLHVCTHTCTDMHAHCLIHTHTCNGFLRRISG